MDSKLDKFLQPKSTKKGIPTLEDLIRFQHTHTKLMNIVINLSIPGPKFPRILYELGYRVEKGSIEATVRFKDEKFDEDLQRKAVTPDIILLNSDKEHLLIFECKTYLVSEEQLKKYKLLSKHPELIVKQAIIPFKKEPKDLKADITYISINDLNNNEVLSKAQDIKILRIIETTPQDPNDPNPIVGEIMLVRGDYKNPEVNIKFKSPIVWHKQEKPSYLIFPVDPEHDTYLFQVHIINELMNIALFGQDLPAQGMVFREDVVLKKGTIIKKEELWLETPEEENEKWTQLINTLEGIAPGECEVKENTIQVLDDILLLKSGRVLDAMKAELINLIGLDINMETLIEKEFTLGQLVNSLYESSGYSIYRYFYRDYRDLIHKRLDNVLKRLSSGSLKTYLKKGQKKRAWRIKALHDRKQIANFRIACEKAIRELEGKLRQKYIQDYIKIFFKQEDEEEVNQ